MRKAIVVLAAVRDGYAVRIGGGQPKVYGGRGGVVATLRELGVDEGRANSYVSGVRPGHAMLLEVPERRRLPRKRADGPAPT